MRVAALANPDVVVRRVVVDRVLEVVPVVDVAVQVRRTQHREDVVGLAVRGRPSGLRRGDTGRPGGSDTADGGHGQQLATGGLDRGERAEQVSRT